MIATPTTPAARRRAAKYRRILRLHALGWTLERIAADPRVLYTARHVRGILARAAARAAAG